MAQPAPILPIPTTLPSIPTDSSLPAFVSTARRLVMGDGELLRHAADAAGGMAVNLAVAGLTLAGTIWVSRWLSSLTARAIHRAHRGRGAGDTTLQSFAASLVRYVVIIVGLVAVLQALGVKTTSVIAVLGAASLAIGLALQGALANVAAGVMLLILRPYRVGDVVEINGRTGTVRGLDLFATRISSGENLRVYVPNAKAFGEVIVNLSAPAARRAQLDFTIDYGDDVDAALAVMRACAQADPRVAPTPEPWVKLTGLGDSGVTVSLRAWFAPKDFEDGHFDLMKAVKDALDAAGFTFPYPHQVAVAEPARWAAPARPDRRAQKATPAAQRRPRKAASN